MKRFHARVEVVKKLKELGLYIETKDNPMQIPICRCVRKFDLSRRCKIESSFSKSGDIIEPMLKPQWWVNCKPLAEEAIKVSRCSLASAVARALR
jgi:valyl-tRNA synthetase